MFLNKQSQIILALDLPNKKKSFDIMDECHDLIDAIKVNYPLILTEGLSIITELKNRYSLPIIADFKVADVPVTNNRIVKLVKAAGADMIMVHGFIGPDALFEIKKIAGDEMGVIVVTELTHPGGLEFTRKFSEDFAKMAAFFQCYGIQAPGTRPDQIKHLRRTVGPDLNILCCGIGSQGGSFLNAIEAGADFCIIGRAIYDSDSPRKAVQEFLLENDHTAIKECKIIRFCSETQRYTVLVEPINSIKEMIENFIQYSIRTKRGLPQEQGMILQHQNSVIHINRNGTCIISNVASIQEGKSKVNQLLEDIEENSDLLTT
ncbi:orotidine-5'-phosphate decarboxylase [Robertmurraya massiliosenegalensis]|uniref:orotidine-5'-phosphate decarboxylase n=1 Tax=Robertmurraya massiliosenegalensis TaxID=1287657 RepID=UPI0003019AD4|nr:orotidine-5'-phosphate decarboxylase [Robertmurraya massiliosenegalensis]